MPLRALSSPLPKASLLLAGCLAVGLSGCDSTPSPTSPAAVAGLPRWEGHARQVFDDNMDGVLTPDEIKSKQFEQFKTHFAEMDTDKSGNLTPKEFLAAMQQMQKQQAAQRSERKQGEAGVHPAQPT